MKNTYLALKVRLLTFIALLGLMAEAFKASAQTNSYGIPDASSLLNSVQTPVNNVAGWWVAISIFIALASMVFYFLRKRK